MRLVSSVTVLSHSSLAIIKSVQKVLIEKKLPFDQSHIIGLDLKTGKSPFLGFTQEARINKRKFITREVIKRDDMDVFIFIDEGPVLSVYRQLTTTHKKRIPEDFKLVSMVQSSYFPIKRNDIVSRLTHIRQDFSTIGQMSIQCLLDILSNKRPINGNKILVPGIFSPGTSIASVIEIDKGSNAYFKSTVSHYINQHFLTDISAKKISQALDLSYTYFLMKFKSCFRSKLNEYINRVRLDRAVHFITTTAKPLTEIYVEVGFNNEVSFVRQFRKRFGQTPSEYRKSRAYPESNLNSV